MRNRVKHTAAPMGLPRHRGGWLLMFCALFVVPALAAPAADRHEGVASCAGGTCHAATRPLGSSGIRQDEYFIWQGRDAHARATATLAGEKSRRMGSLLGLEPTRSPQCLACHADHIATEQQGERWLASDGIGCESCHGGSERWLAAHTKPGITLKEKAALGMTPTWQPQARASLCLSCHQGDAGHEITHAMMAAGHPALLFELDTFTALAPPHYDRDADYQARKGEQDPANDWIVGQLAAADQLLAAISSGRLGHGLFPELAYFDCDSCHHPMSADRWLPGRNAGTVPGTPPLADTALYWVGLWLNSRAPQVAQQWQQRVAALQAATQKGAAPLEQAARSLRELSQRSVWPLVSGRALDGAELKALLAGIAATSESARARDFLTAEQAAMAAVVISDALTRRGISSSTAQKNAINRLFTAVHDRDAFSPKDYGTALQNLHESLR